MTNEPFFASTSFRCGSRPSGPNWVQRLIPGEPPRSALHVRAKHLTYIISRVAYHARTLPPTLWLGLRLRWSTKELGREFFIFLGTSFFFTLGMYIYFLLYNLYLLDRGLQENFLGLITSALGTGGIAGTIPAGVMAQRFGLRNTLLVCVTLVAIISGLRALVISQATLLGLAFLAGAATSIWAVSLPPAIAQLTGEKSRPLGFSIVFSSTLQSESWAAYLEDICQDGYSHFRTSRHVFPPSNWHC